MATEDDTAAGSGCAGTRAKSIPTELHTGMRYFVDGILHEYLGVARLPGGEGIAHVFLLNEWRPDSAGRLPLALVDEGGLGESVADTEIEGSGCGS